MATLTVENYVKAIYQICAETHKASAQTGELAKRLGVSPGSVTSMFRTLADSGLANYQAYEGVTLSDAGSRLALRVLRRHRLIELFLVRTLSLTWDEVHAEAENLEHAISDGLIDRIDRFLEFPDRDPHGDPIPKSDGTVSTDTGLSLADFPAGQIFVLDRVLDQSPNLLRYLSRSGLGIGCSAEIIESDPSAGAVTLSIDGRHITLGLDVAQKLRVRPGIH